VSAAVGKTWFNGVKYHTTARNVTGLLAAGVDGINHGEFDQLSSCSSDSSGSLSGIAQDGIVTLLTVTID
jgi:hypothetical protein